MTFEASGTLTLDEIVASDSAVTSVESELGDIGPIDIGSGGGVTSVSGNSTSSGLTSSGVTDTLNEQTEIQREILDEIAGPGSGGLSTGGLDLNAADLLTVTGTLGLTAGAVLAVSGVLAVAATSVLTVTGTVDMNAADILATTGVLTLGIASVVAVSGVLALSAPAVLAVTGAVGLAAGSVLAVTGVIDLNAGDILSVTGVLTIAAGAALAITGVLSLPASAAIAVVGTITLAVGQIIDISGLESGDGPSGELLPEDKTTQDALDDLDGPAGSESDSGPTMAAGQISPRERRLLSDPSAVSNRSVTDLTGDARRQFANGRGNPVQMPGGSGNQARQSGTTETTVEQTTEVNAPVTVTVESSGDLERQLDEEIERAKQDILRTIRSREGVSEISSTQQQNFQRNF